MSRRSIMKGTEHKNKYFILDAPLNYNILTGKIQKDIESKLTSYLIKKRNMVIMVIKNIHHKFYFTVIGY